MPACSLYRVTSCFLQRRLCCFSCHASWGVSCRGRCVRVTCGCRCWRDPPAALSPACREPHAAPCCCSSFCWPTLCGTALWWTRDTGIGRFSFVLPSSLSTCLCVHITTTDDVFWHLCCSPRAVSRVASLSGETVAAGVVTCLIVYPLYLLVFTLFRMSRSKVTRTCPKLLHSQGFSATWSWSWMFVSLWVNVCVWTSVCVCGAGATTSGPGVGGDWWLPGQLHGWKLLPLF